MLFECSIFIANIIFDENEELAQREIYDDNERCTVCDILRNHYSAISESIIDPVSVASLLRIEKVVNEEALTTVISTRNSPFDCKGVLLKAIRHSVHSNHGKLEVVLSILSKFQETEHIAGVVLKKYRK